MNVLGPGLRGASIMSRGQVNGTRM